MHLSLFFHEPVQYAGDLSVAQHSLRQPQCASLGHNRICRCQWAVNISLVGWLIASVLQFLGAARCALQAAMPALDGTLQCHLSLGWH